MQNRRRRTTALKAVLESMVTTNDNETAQTPIDMEQRAVGGPANTLTSSPASTSTSNISDTSAQKHRFWVLVRTASPRRF